MGYFLPFCPPLLLTAQKITISKKKKKMKNTPGDIIILNNCTKNYDYRLFCSWDMACDRCNCYFSFWAIFCPFTPITAQKMKKTPRDIILHKCTKTHNHMLYCSWDMVCDGYNCYFSFWAIFCPFTSLTAQKMKISQKWNT